MALSAMTVECEQFFMGIHFATCIHFPPSEIFPLLSLGDLEKEESQGLWELPVDTHLDPSVRMIALSSEPWLSAGS